MRIYLDDTSALALIKFLNNNIEDNQRMKMIVAGELGKIQSLQAIQPLVSAFDDNYDNNVKLKKYAIQILEQYTLQETTNSNEKIVEILIKALKDKDCDYGVRVALAETSVNIGGEKLIDTLIPLLNDESDSLSDEWDSLVGSIVRGGVARALGNIGSEKVIDTLISLLNDKSDYVRGTVAEVLGKIGSERAVEALISAFQEENCSIKRQVIRALGQIGGERAVEAIIYALKDEDNNLEAVFALGEIGSRSAVEALISAFEDKKNKLNFRFNVVGALGKIRDERAVEALIAALNNQDNDLDIKINAAELLGKISNKMTNKKIVEKAVDALIVALNNSWAIKKIAAESLGNIGSDKAVDALIAALNDQNTKNVAAESLGNISNGLKNKKVVDKAVDALIVALNDQDIKEIVQNSLGMIGSDKGIKPLFLSLEGENSDVSSFISYRVESLEKNGSLNILEILIQSPNINLYDPKIFMLVRKLAIKHRKSDSFFIPVYPELVQQQTPENEN